MTECARARAHTHTHTHTHTPLQSEQEARRRSRLGQNGTQTQRQPHPLPTVYQVGSHSLLARRRAAPGCCGSERGVDKDACAAGSGWPVFSPWSFPVSPLLSAEKRSQLPASLHVHRLPTRDRLSLRLRSVLSCLQGHRPDFSHISLPRKLHSFRVLHVSGALRSYLLLTIQIAR